MQFKSWASSGSVHLSVAACRLLFSNIPRSFPITQWCRNGWKCWYCSFGSYLWRLFCWSRWYDQKMHVHWPLSSSLVSLIYTEILVELWLRVRPKWCFTTEAVQTWKNKHRIIYFGSVVFLLTNNFHSGHQEICVRPLKMLPVRVDSSQTAGPATSPSVCWSGYPEGVLVNLDMGCLYFKWTRNSFKSR